MSTILDRIDAALERCAFRHMEVRAIYLTVEDHDALNVALCAEYGDTAAFLAYRDIQIRRGTRSRIYSKEGVEVSVPARLSPKVAA